jgi:hypothetical protein
MPSDRPNDHDLPGPGLGPEVSPSDLLFKRLTFSIAILGALARIVQFLWARSFWKDEAMLWMNIVYKTPRQLMGHLDYGQAAPPAFLWAEHAMALCFGTGEYSLRLVSLVLGLGALAGFVVLARRLLSPCPAFLAVTFFSLSDKFIARAAEVKQYSGDLFFAVLLLLLATGFRRRPSPLRGFLLITAVAIIGVWFSHPVVIVFAAISLAMLPRFLARGWGGRLLWLGANLLVFLSFGLLYWLSIRYQQIDPYLQAYWQDQFADWSHPWKMPLWLAAGLYGICNDPYQPFGFIMAIMVSAGLVSLCQSRRRDLMMLLVGPIALVLVAACLRQYPFGGGRIVLFAIPGLMLLAAEGFDWLIHRWGHPLPAGAPALAVFRNWWWLLPLPILLSGIGQSLYRLAVPRAHSHIRPVVEYVRAHRQPGEGIYIIGEASNSRDLPDFKTGRWVEFLCYWQPEPPVAVTMALDQSTHPHVLRIPERRFWIAWSSSPGQGLRLMQPFLDIVRQQAVEKDRCVTDGGSAFLFEAKPTTGP